MACRSSLTTGVCVLVSASDSGVPPQRSTGCGSAPAASRYRTTSAWPSAAARCSGVRPSQALAQWRAGTADAVAYDVPVAAARSACAHLVGVDPSAVAVGSQVSMFAGLIAANLPDGSEVLT